MERSHTASYLRARYACGQQWTRGLRDDGRVAAGTEGHRQPEKSMRVALLGAKASDEPHDAWEVESRSFWAETERQPYKAK